MYITQSHNYIASLVIFVLLGFIITLRVASIHKKRWKSVLLFESMIKLHYIGSNVVQTCNVIINVKYNKHTDELEFDAKYPRGYDRVHDYVLQIALQNHLKNITGMDINTWKNTLKDSQK